MSFRSFKEDAGISIADYIRRARLSEAARNLSLGMNNIHYEKVAAEEVNYPEHSFDAITACQCFCYFNPELIVPKIKSLIKKGGIFLKLYISYLKEEPITQDSNALIKKINPSWHGRMLVSRGVMASMNEEELLQFDKEHRTMLEEKYPEKFSIKHKIFLTWYRL